VNLVLDVTRTLDGRLEGRLSSGPSEPGHDFSGVLELLKALEDLLDGHDCAAAPEGPAR
jgi:hypothetical protein